MAWMALHGLNADHTMQAQCGAVSEHKAKVAHHRRSGPGASAKAQADAEPRPDSGTSSPHACCSHGQQAVPGALIALRAAMRVVWPPKPAGSGFGMQDCTGPHWGALPLRERLAAAQRACCGRTLRRARPAAAAAGGWRADPRLAARTQARVALPGRARPRSSWPDPPPSRSTRRLALQLRGGRRLVLATSACGCTAVLIVTWASRPTNQVPCPGAGQPLAPFRLWRGVLQPDAGSGQPSHAWLAPSPQES